MWLRGARTVAAPGVLVALVGVLLAAAVAQSDRSWPVRLGALAVAIASGAAAVLGGRRWDHAGEHPAPWRSLVSALTGGAAVAVLCSGGSANLGWFAIVVAAGWTATIDLRRFGVPFTSAAIVQFVVQWVAVHDAGWFAWITGTLFCAVMCAMGRRQRELIDRLRAAQAELDERARSEERQRIARELHDVIGHAITVSLLHVSSARLALEEDDPAEAASALREAERVTREGLTEVRQAVGLLQDERSTAGERDAVRPLPGVADVDQLVERVRRAGAPVELAVSGDVGAVPATVGLTVHRIVQEALTNAMRHGAPAGVVDVRVAVERRAVVVTIDSEGRPSAPSSGGTGIAGMRARAAAVGGTCAAGPHGDGWRVHAVLPIVGAGAVPGRTVVAR